MIKFTATKEIISFAKGANRIMKKYDKDACSKRFIGGIIFTNGKMIYSDGHVIAEKTISEGNWDIEGKKTLYAGFDLFKKFLDLKQGDLIKMWNAKEEGKKDFQRCDIYNTFMQVNEEDAISCINYSYDNMESLIHEKSNQRRNDWDAVAVFDFKELKDSIKESLKKYSYGRHNCSEIWKEEDKYFYGEKDYGIVSGEVKGLIEGEIKYMIDKHISGDTYLSFICARNVALSLMCAPSKTSKVTIKMQRDCLSEIEFTVNGEIAQDIKCYMYNPLKTFENEKENNDIYGSIK